MIVPTATRVEQAKSLAFPGDAAEGRTGRIEQGRFYAGILEEAHWATAVRYVEQNPVPARIVKHAEAHRSASARP